MKSLPEVGVDVWTRDTRTQVIVAGFAIDDEPPRTAFKSGDAMDLVTAAGMGAEIHAWNAAFEFAVWNNIKVPQYGWPKLPIEQFHCTMATAACAGLPMDLEQAAPAAGVAYHKDTAGRATMLRMARPRGFDSAGVPVWWHETDPTKLRALIEYNKTDVEAERAISKAIPRMDERERQIWLADQRMNQRGMPVDHDLLHRMKDITDFEVARLNGEIDRGTWGAVTSVTQNAKLLQWAQSYGYPLQTLERDELERYLQSFNVEPEMLRVALEARLEASKTSTAKIKSIRRYAQADGYCRNLVQYGGATRTLRWAGRGPQIQNFPRPVIDHVAEAIKGIKAGMDADTMRFCFGKPLDVVSSCLRGTFLAPKGWKFIVVDYGQVEARVLAWLAGHEDLLDVFRRGEDVYLYTVKAIGGSSRMLGKVLTLACGYGMGAVKFQETAKGYGLELSIAMAQVAVSAWRLANKPIVELWSEYEHDAVRAMQTRFSMSFGSPRVQFSEGEDALKGCLTIRLPSGRDLVYRNARLEQGKLSYDGVNQYTHKWETITTYGGKLVENVTQAVARDLIADALVDLDTAYPGTIVATVHDELVALAPDDLAQDVYDKLQEIMSEPPNWAPGLPLEAKGFVGERYGK